MQTYFNTEISSVHIIAKEKVACAGWWTTDLKQLHQVKELPMDVSTNYKQKMQEIKHDWENGTFFRLHFSNDIHIDYYSSYISF